MATKQELETELETLKKELTDLKSGDTTGILAQLAQLKTDLDASAAELETAKSELEKQKKLHDEALGDAKAWKKKADEEADARTKQTAELEAAAAELVSIADNTTPLDNVVVLDGATYPIIHKNSVKELSIDLLKRHVDETFTAVVIALKY